MAQVQDFDAYLRRIGLEPGTMPTPAELHRAHATSIPFENLGPATGSPPSIELAAVEQKLVTDRRGGYCFEHNTLFAGALASIGVDDVVPLLGRVRYPPAPERRPLTHLLLRGVIDGEPWHFDVGFGGEGLLEPVPFGPGDEIEQSGWRYRVVADGAELVLQLQRDGGWIDLYGFLPEPAVPVDLAVGNWFAATHPHSPFRAGLFVARQEPGIRWTLAGRDGEATLTERTASPEAVTVTAVAPGGVPALLADLFGLGHAPVPPVWSPAG